MDERARVSGEPTPARREGTDDNVTLGAADDDWGWRRRVRADPTTHRPYRVAVGVAGLVIVVAGLVAVPAPGPGWLIVLVGVSVWARSSSGRSDCSVGLRVSLERATE